MSIEHADDTVVRFVNYFRVYLLRLQAIVLNLTC